LSALEKFAQLDKILNDDEMPVMEFSSSALQTVELIGSGEFGQLHVCQLNNSRHVLVKYANKDARSMKGFARETRVLNRLAHQNCCRMIGVVHDDGKLGMVMEFPTNGDLPNWLRKQQDIG
jgi:serine/threonine protein kinase